MRGATRRHYRGFLGSLLVGFWGIIYTVYCWLEVDDFGWVSMIFEIFEDEDSWKIRRDL